MSTDSLPLRWLALHTHKRGNAADEYEDAFAGDTATARFAIADGASESSFAAAWAKLLVEGFVAAPRRPWRDLAWLEPARQRWAEDVDHLPLPWFAEEKRAQGAYATLLGLAFNSKRAKEGWHAVAIGDSCLFRFRAGKLDKSFPVARASEFGNVPALLGSRGRAVDTLVQGIRHARGKGRPGDRLVLATDALAEWLLRQHERERRPAQDIERLLTESAPQDAFAGWIEERRDRQGLRNDDVTLLVLDFMV